VLKGGYAADPVGLDPALAVAFASHLVIEQTYSNLVALDKDLNAIPDLAEKWEKSDDNLSYTFHLRQGVTFHNGSELTSDDVKFTLDRLLDKKTGYFWRGQLSPIKQVDVPDKYTVKLTLSQPHAPLMIGLSFPGAGIVSKAEVQKSGDLKNTLMGTGPFKMVNYTPKKSMTLQKFDKYYNPSLPLLDGLELDFIDDATARTNALLTKSVDLLQDIPAKDFQAISTTPGIVAYKTLGHHWDWIGFNTKRKPFDDKRVRQAVSFALDRQAIADNVFFGMAEPITGGPVPRWSFGYDGGGFYGAKPNVEKAKQLLADAGLSSGFKTTLKVTSTYPQISLPAPLVKDALGKVGVDVEIISLEWGVWLKEVLSGDYNFDMYYVGYGSPLIDPDDFLYSNFDCTGGSDVLGTRGCDSEVDKLLEQGRSTLDVNKRKEFYVQAQKLLSDGEPLANTVNELILQAHWDYVKGFKPISTGLLRPLMGAWLSK
jgi:peptide/nickel transport system substrate-binding protein